MTGYLRFGGADMLLTPFVMRVSFRHLISDVAAYHERYAARLRNCSEREARA